MSLFIFDEISLVGSHFFLAKQRRIGTGPDKPHDILTFSLFLCVKSYKCFSDIGLQHIVQDAAGILLPIYIHLFEASVFVHGHTAMVHQVSIIYLVQVTPFQQKLHMGLQTAAV